jgi:hypothetical protein
MSKKTRSKKKNGNGGSTISAANATGADPDLVPLTRIDKEKKTATMAKGAKPKAAKAGTEKKMSCLDAAAQVLKDKGEPMQCKSMVEAMFQKKLWHSDAPTPAATLSSAILREMKKGKDSRFKKTGRGQFALRA